MDMTDNLLSREIQVQDSVSEDYESVRHAKEYSLLYQNIWNQELVSLISNSGRILDNGCGIGHLSQFLPEKDLVGFDISGGMLKKAKNRMQYLIRGDSQLLPFKDEIFDVIVCRSLLHHLPDPTAGIHEMERVLKSNGEIIFAEPIESLLSSLPRHLVARSDHFSEVHKDFRREEFIELVEEKFFITEVRHFGYIAYPLIGFPDIVDPLRIIPFKKGISSFLISIDRIIAKMPIVQHQSWGIMVKAIKKETK
jgi:ubiquinone/menaquinone biosynthesis C-methylase UbiE